ncbi:MAG: hypothetical protein PWP08_877 [Methanofollis sp.]|nr:hypothetical protein [Methanofollis sp.]
MGRPIRMGLPNKIYNLNGYVLHMQWSDEQLALARKYRKIEDVPEDERRYKCHTCSHVVETKPCPVCGETELEIMCPLDHTHCSHEIVSGIEYCPLCGEPVCPECGSHDVSQISRVTGYLQDVSGWNAGKQQELKDRVRYTVA